MSVNILQLINKDIAIRQNGVEYYNIEEHKEQKKNKEEHIATTPSLISLDKASPNSIDIELAQERLDSRERKVVMESEIVEEESPLGPHNVKRAIVQLFNNEGGQRKLKIRLNLDDGTNAEFIAPMQPKSNLTNFLRYTADSKDAARLVFTGMRKHVKNVLGVTPQQGKFHENTGARATSMKPIQVEPGCYGAVGWNAEDKTYIGWIVLYGLCLNAFALDDDYISDKQKATGVRGQYLWINPKFDQRKRPKTWAEKRKEANTRE